jgi:hypothetical protein
MARRPEGSAASHEAESEDLELTAVPVGEDTIISATDEFTTLLASISFGGSAPRDGGFDSWNFFTFG